MKRLVTTFASATLVVLFGASASAAPLSLSQQPLFVATAAKPNVLMVLANSNSMDEDASGLAVGSASPNSKSEIARRVAKNLVANYANTLNMGLVAFQQLTTGGDPVRLYPVHSSPYDLSYVPEPLRPDLDRRSNGAEAPFQAPNVSAPGPPALKLYYNVNLPFYDSREPGQRVLLFEIRPVRSATARRSRAALGTPTAASATRPIRPTCCRRRDPAPRTS